MGQRFRAVMNFVNCMCNNATSSRSRFNYRVLVLHNTHVLHTFDNTTLDVCFHVVFSKTHVNVCYTLCYTSCCFAVP